MLLVVVLGSALIAGACETSSTLSAGPDPVKCQVALGTMPMVEAAGGAGTLAVTTQPECAWEASTTANWISGLSPAAGQGTGNVAFRVGPNQGTSSRDGTIVVNGQQVVVSQRAPCRYTLTPANQNASANGGDGSITVATADECAWAASTDVGWISLTPPLTGSGNGTVSFAIAANPGAARSGSVIVAGERSTVTQAAVAAPAPAPVCTTAIAPTSQAIGASGGAGTTITVTAQAGCQWTAVSNASWITVTSGASGNGPGAVGFSVAANTGAARTGTLTIATLTFTVTQAAGSGPPPPPCTYSISSSSQTVVAAGGPGTVGVTAGGGCTWTASSSAAWITITSGATGTGNGSVAFSVAANTGAARMGSLTIAGQTFTVNQEAFVAPPPCTYSISPTSQSVDASALAGTVSVTAGSGCAWTATSNAPWITITAGATGTANGSVAFTVAANTGTARTGTATIAGQVFTVNQAAAPPPPCTYSISPGSQNFTALGGVGTVNVTAVGSSCSWTATSGAPWITVTSGSPGNGNGSVTFGVAPNSGVARTGTVTIAGQAFTVTQNAALGGVR